MLPLAEKIEYIRFFSSSRMVYLYALFAAFAFGVGTVFDAYLCRSVAALNTFRGVAYLVRRSNTTPFARRDVAK